MLAICSTSSDEGPKSIYPHEDDSESMFNPTSSAIVTAASSSSRIPYSHRSPAPFVYSHTPTPTYGFGLGFYEDMPSFTGKDLFVETKEFLWRRTVSFRCFTITVYIYSYDKTCGSKYWCETWKYGSVETFCWNEFRNDNHEKWKVRYPDRWEENISSWDESLKTN